MSCIYIFGAKATAVGLYKALTLLHPAFVPDAFIVTNIDGNPTEIWGCPVLTLEEVEKNLSVKEKSESVIYVAVPELIHEEIRSLLIDRGFCNLNMVDSVNEAGIMEQYYERKGIFPSIHALKRIQEKNLSEIPKTTVYAASYYRDKVLEQPPKFSPYIRKLYLGCDQARKVGADLNGAADFFDDTEDSISNKNSNRCEMTGYYWVWKNRLDTEDEYVGICHYRRMLDISDDDLIKIKQNNIDVVLPFPMIHYPDCSIHHTWYVKDEDWDVMVKVLNEIHPEYAAAVRDVFGKPYFYNYNIMLAKKKVFADYCDWLFPVLDRIEELSEPKGSDRSDRYTAYLSESLTTLYFMHNINNLKIAHTGRLLFT